MRYCHLLQRNLIISLINTITAKQERLTVLYWPVQAITPKLALIPNSIGKKVSSIHHFGMICGQGAQSFAFK